jgi:signal transduction histidine kinase
MLDRQITTEQAAAAPPDTMSVPAEADRRRDGGGTRRDRVRPASDPASDLGRVRAVIEALPEPVFVTESDGELRLTNPAADRLFAGQPIHDRADLLSRFEELPSDPDGRRQTVSPQTVSSQDPQRPVTVRPRHEPNRWYALRAVALDTIDPRPEPGDLTGLPSAADDAGATLYMLRDVTDSRDLRPAREAFLAVLSHELRTPITTIYAGSSVLARRPTLSPPATRTLARDISAEAARLYDLVEDLLVLARLERRVLEPLDEPVLVQRAIDATIRMAADRLGDAPVERRGDAAVPPVHGDAVYVEQVCRNMILAGLRYAGRGPGRQLIVDVRSDRDAGEVTIAVLDRGPNLTAEELVGVFELPEPSAIGRLAGLGVGPFVSRHLVEAMGGRVWARNRPDGGLEMGVALHIDERA